METSKAQIRIVVAGAALVATALVVMSRIQHASTGAERGESQLHAEAETATKARVLKGESPRFRDRNSPEEKERQRLLAKNRELDEELQRTKERAGLIGDVAMKLAQSGKLNMPQTSAEAAVLAGQVHRAGFDFAARWGGKQPPKDDPEFHRYKEESDALTSDMATVIKSIEDFFGGDLANSATSVAQFQSLQIYGALELDDAHWETLDSALLRYYENGFSSGLNGANQPESGVEEWRERRVVASQQAFDEIQRLLPGEKRNDFTRLYERDNFMWSFSLGR